MKVLRIGLLVLLALCAGKTWAQAYSLTATVNSPTQVSLAWTSTFYQYLDGSGQSYDEIDRSTDSVNWTAIGQIDAANSAPSLTYVDTTALPNTTYYYRASEYIYDSDYGDSNIVTVTTLAGTPSLSATTTSATQINLSWVGNNNGQTGFEIDRSTGNDSNYAQIVVTTPNATGYSDTGLTPGNTYYYRISAVFSAGSHSPYSNEVSVVLTGTPAAPSGLAASAVSSNQINLTWTDNDTTQTGFKIQRKMGSGGVYAEVATAGTSATSYSDIGLTGGITYYYRLQATNGWGDSGYSNETNATTSSGGNSATTGIRTSGFEYDPATGLLTKEIIEPDSSNLCVVTTYTYDSFGNKTAATTRNCDGDSSEAPAPAGNAVFASRTISTSYDSAGRFAISATNALSQTETHVYDGNFGNMTSLTGPNGLTTTWTYDSFGRKTFETRADGTKTQWEYLFCNGVNGGTTSCPSGAQYLVRVTPENASGTANGPVSETYFDMLGREIRSETQGFDGTAIYKDTQYDNEGRVYRRSDPYYSNATPVWTTVQYDALGRMTQQTSPNGGVLTTTYNGLTTVVTDPANHTETRVKNSQGQLISVTRQ